MKHKVSKLAFKFIIGFIILGVLICAVSSIIGYNQYKSNIEKQYNTTAYQVADVAKSYVTQEDMQAYVDMVQGYRAGTVTEEEIKAAIDTDKYRDISHRLNTLREKTNANDVILLSIDMDMLKSFTPETADTWMHRESQISS